MIFLPLRHQLDPQEEQNLGAAALWGGTQGRREQRRPQDDANPSFLCGFEVQIDAIVLLISAPLSPLKAQPWSELFLWDHFWDLKEAWHGWQLFLSVGSSKI